MRLVLLLFIFLFPPLVISSQGQTTPTSTSQPTTKKAGKGKSFVKKLSAKALIALTENESAGLRCSAFVALVNMNHNKVKAILVNHIEDDEKLPLGFLWGLVSDYEQVNQFMLEQLNPDTSECQFKLTKQEYEICRKAIYN